MKIVVHSFHHSPRLIYAADFLLGQILGFEVDYTSEKEKTESKGTIHLYYGKARPVFAKFFLPAHPMLEESAILSPLVEVHKTNGLTSFFHLPEIENPDLPFDLFALTFYLLSRFEEYDQSIERDEHQRFSAKSSLAYQQNFLHQPLIDCWAWRLYDLLKVRFPNCPDRKPSYHFLPTIDVDFAWAYLHKSSLRTIRTLLKSILGLNGSLFLKQVNVLLGKEKDPYDTFEFLQKTHQVNNVKALFFMLLGEYGTYDKNHPGDHPKMQLLMKQLAADAEVGIHPSYISNNNFTTLKKEKILLEKALGKTVLKSRQHFLKLNLPKTYHWLLKVGIKEDYSMGYADAVGFRASTAYPFYWYDLEKDERTNLRIFPFAVMDVTLKRYLNLAPQEALTKTTELIAQVRQTGGHFSLLWHNSSFSAEMGWEEWGGIYEKIVALANQDPSAK
ncbi:MAG: polysaccharide deacetylase family protein [Saprospiraceae bacterium]